MGGLRTLRGLSIEKLITASLEDEDAPWFDSSKLDMFPDLPKALISYLFILVEQGVNVAARDLLSRLFIDSLSLKVSMFSTPSTYISLGTRLPRY